MPCRTCHVRCNPSPVASMALRRCLALQLCNLRELHRRTWCTCFPNAEADCACMFHLRTCLTEGVECVHGTALKIFEFPCCSTVLLAQIGSDPGRQRVACSSSTTQAHQRNEAGCSCSHCSLSLSCPGSRGNTDKQCRPSRSCCFQGYAKNIQALELWRMQMDS